MVGARAAAGAARGVLLGVAGGLLGCWVVLFGLAYPAESLAHAVLPGLVLAALLGVPLLVGGAVGLVVAALAMALAGRAPRTESDTAVAVVVTALLGLGALLALAPATPAGLGRLLFGDVLGLGDADVVLAGALALVLAGALALAHPALLAVGFDRTHAAVLGRPAGRRRPSWPSSWPPRCSSPCAAWATCSWSRCSWRRPPPRAS